MNLPASMRALAHRPFRLYFFGQAVSILGSWIQLVALAGFGLDAVGGLIAGGIAALAGAPATWSANLRYSARLVPGCCCAPDALVNP